jgi:hypothetical protein
MSPKFDQELYNQIVPQEVADRIEARYKIACKVGHLFYGNKYWMGMLINNHTMLYCIRNSSSVLYLMFWKQQSVIDWYVLNPTFYNTTI